MLPMPVDRGGFYQACRCEKPPSLRWDPHPDCLEHIPHFHYEAVLRDVDGEPACDFCRSIPMSVRLRWTKMYQRHWGLEDAYEAQASMASVGLSYGQGAIANVSVRPGSDDIPPSGTVREDGNAEIPSISQSSLACYSGGAEPEDMWPETNKDTGGEEDSSPGLSQPSHEQDGEQQGGSESFIAAFKALFSRAVQTAVVTPDPERPQDPMVEDFPKMKEKTRDSLLPAYPHLERAYKKAEADALLKSSSKCKHKGVDVLSVEVRNLNYKDWKIPVPEKDVLSFNPGTKTNAKDAPKHPTVWGQSVDRLASDAWHASLRAAGLISTAGMITAYMRKLCSISSVEAHKTALNIAGIDSEKFGELVGSDAGFDYIFEMEKIADSLGPLLYSIALECGTSAAAATLVRRRLWLEAAGVKDEFCTKWMAHPCAGSQGLFGTTPELIGQYKTAHAERDTLHKELTPMMKATTTPVPSVGKGQSATKAAEKQKWREHYSKRGRGRGNRGRGQNLRSHSQSSNEPAAKTAKSESSDAGKKPNASK